MLSVLVALNMPPPQPHWHSPLLVNGTYFFDVVGNRAHADLIAQVTDGDIRHTVGAQLFPQHIAAGL